MYKYIFGPVVSRRLGLSLGIDLVPFKTCPFDCVYCECGATTNLTVKRAEYVPVDDVCTEISTYMKTAESHPDYITFSGSGEPTLHTGIGDIIKYIKSSFPEQKIALLTNAALLDDSSLRRDILDCDLIVPSLDAVSPRVFKNILGPHSSLDPQKIIDSIAELRNEYSGKLVIEFFIVPGQNDTPEELALIKSALDKIRPDALQINSLDRPGTSSLVTKPDDARLEQIAAFFDNVDVQLVKRPDYLVKTPQGRELLRRKIISTVKRRPSTIEDLMVIVGMAREELLTVIEGYIDEGLIKTEEGERGIFYRAAKQEEY